MILLSLLALSTLIIALVFGVRSRGLAKQLTKQVVQLQELERSLRTVQQENSALVIADLNFGRQLGEFTRQLVSMEHQIQGLENQRTNDGGYQHALRILEMGGDKGEIMKSCHLSNAEAELMINLHAYQTAISKNKSSRNPA